MGIQRMWRVLGDIVYKALWGLGWAFGCLCAWAKGKLHLKGIFSPPPPTCGNKMHMEILLCVVYAVFDPDI